jgi:hypothetical protein
VSNGEVLSVIVEGLTRENIAAVVEGLPAEWRVQVVADFHERAKAASPDELIDLTGGIFKWELESDSTERERLRAEYERERAQARAHYWNTVLPAIRWWLDTHGRA